MAITTLGPGYANKSGVVTFDGHQVITTWECTIPTNPDMKACTEAVCAEAAKMRDYTKCAIRSVPHGTSRIGGQYSTQYVQDDLHTTANFTKVRFGKESKPVTAHIYVGPRTYPTQDYSQTRIYREGGKPTVKWFDPEPQQSRQARQTNQAQRANQYNQGNNQPRNEYF
ncbi:uncharacterized protein RCO7_08307 [Rhynchosporium graminicola]|uniref:Uncharacterized protein n=1 Tax=Rhynchosporium graminicola TaxID=2792576 RepID=A0A1E1KQP9_9HELO|nr:uncharacterized protein RCO7_08307 [Rhynchosporium commune]